MYACTFMYVHVHVEEDSSDGRVCMYSDIYMYMYMYVGFMCAVKLLSFASKLVTRNVCVLINIHVHVHV